MDNPFHLHARTKEPTKETCRWQTFAAEATQSAATVRFRGGRVAYILSYALPVSAPLSLDRQSIADARLSISRGGSSSQSGASPAKSGTITPSDAKQALMK